MKTDDHYPLICHKYSATYNWNWENNLNKSAELNLSEYCLLFDIYCQFKVTSITEPQPALHWHYVGGWTPSQLLSLRFSNKVCRVDCNRKTLTVSLCDLTIDRRHWTVSRNLSVNLPTLIGQQSLSRKQNHKKHME